MGRVHGCPCSDGSSDITHDGLCAAPSTPAFFFFFFCVCMWLSFSLQRTRSSLSSLHVCLFLHFSIFFFCFHLPPPLKKRRRLYFVSRFPFVFFPLYYYYYYYYGHFHVCLKGKKSPLRLFFFSFGSPYASKENN